MHTKPKPTHYRPLCGGHWRAGCGESSHAQFGGGPMEKGRLSGTSPAAYPTLRGLGGRKAPWLPDHFRAGEFDRQELQRRLIPLQARLGRLLRRGQGSPDRKAAGLCRELTKWWAALWTFARVEGVEPTNNVAERALRPTVLWRKGSFGSDSAAGSRFVERLLTVVASCRQQGRSLLAFLVAAGEAALRGSPPPSLLSAGPGS
jgi:transposase